MYSGLGFSKYNAPTCINCAALLYLLQTKTHRILSYLCTRHYPIGVLFDLYGSNKSLPWNITVHFEVNNTLLNKENEQRIAVLVKRSQAQNNAFLPTLFIVVNNMC